MSEQKLKVLLAACGGWHLPETAKAFHARKALVALWVSVKNSGLPLEKYRRPWPFHLAMKPFYHLAPQIWIERAFYALFPVWKSWLRKQDISDANVVQAIIGYGTELFDIAEKKGCLKVIDCPNSNPLTYYGFWQRECDLWCPGETVPIPRWMFARMNRELERADLIVVQSIFCKESMMLNGIPGEKVMVNPMGVDTAIFKKRFSVPAKPRFVSVATICLRKGHQYLFRAFEIVKKKLPEAELICVGDYKSDFRLERPRWENIFTHYPKLSHPKIAELFQGCTAFVFPSQEEGIARAQIEALASGLPVVGYHEGGATTLIQDGVEGFIVLGRNPEKIAEAMIKLATNPQLNEQMSHAAFQKGSVKNTWLDYGNRLLTGSRPSITMKIAILTTDNRYRNPRAPFPCFGAAPEALLQGFEMFPELEVHVISCVREPLSSPEKLRQNIFFHGLHVPKVGWMSTAYQGCIRAARKKIHEIRPHIVHGQGTELDSALSAVFCGFPNVITIHGNMAELARLVRARIGSFGWLAAHFEDFALKKTGGVFCNSAYTENLVQPRARKTWRVANPIRKDFFLTAVPETQPAKCILVNVGVVCERKRQLELLEVARKIHQKGLKLELQFIGVANSENAYASKFLDEFRKAETAGYARYLGCKSTADLIRCFDEASGLVHFPNEEAFGLVVAEGLSRNLKFFGTRVGGVIDITDGVPGAELFALDDWAGLEEAISRWISEGAPKKPMGTATLMERRYAPKQIALRHVEIYREVLNNLS